MPRSGTDPGGLANQKGTIKLLLIHNGDHLEYEQANVLTPPEGRSDWPLPSFDARDWAKAFVKLHGGDEELLTTWFANALMRGYDEGRFAACSDTADIAFENDLNS